MKTKPFLLALVLAISVAGQALAQQPSEQPPADPATPTASKDHAVDQMAGTPEQPGAPTAQPPREGVPTAPDAPAPGDAKPADAKPADAKPGETKGPALPQWITDLNNEHWDTGGNFWLPTRASAEAYDSDYMFIVVLGLSGFFFIAILAAVVWFTIKYRARPGHRAQPSSSHNDALEITWTVIPTIIVVFLFIGGWQGYIKMKTRQPDAIEIKVVAKKWNWDFEYPNGLHTPDLYVPKDRPIELKMTSMDVLHAFFVPAFRVKQDIVPRRYTYLDFIPIRNGTYRLYCAEYCGRDHSQMKVKAHVLDYSQWERLLTEAKNALQKMDPVDLGKLVFETKGCNGCHTVDGSAKVGPSWKGIYGQEAAMADGSKVTVDDQYIHTSIVEPQKQSRPGFPPSMPTYAGQLSEAEINGVAKYIESLK
jgi:cytochrome c oxidase subunit II